MVSTSESEKLCWENCGRISQLRDFTKKRLWWAFCSLEGKSKINERLEETYRTIAEACRAENLEMTVELIEDHIPSMVFNVAMDRGWLRKGNHPHFRRFARRRPGGRLYVEWYRQPELTGQFGCYQVREDYPDRFKKVLSGAIAAWLREVSTTAEKSGVGGPMEANGGEFASEQLGVVVPDDQVEIIQDFDSEASGVQSLEPKEKAHNDDARQRLASFIFDAKEKRLSHEKICADLDGREIPTPQKSKWSHLSWSRAYSNERFNSSVRKYISTAILREQTRRNKP